MPKVERAIQFDDSIIKTVENNFAVKFPIPQVPKKKWVDPEPNNPDASHEPPLVDKYSKERNLKKHLKMYALKIANKVSYDMQISEADKNKIINDDID